MIGLRVQLRVLGVALAQWDDTKPCAEARQAANTAMRAVDGLLRDLHQFRSCLLAKIRLSDDASMGRSEASLARLREEGDQ
jgi:predicted component of type VI protein secretion system